MLGGVEGKGFYQLMGELPQERLIIAMGAMTGIEKPPELTLEFVKDRKAFGQTIWDVQNTPVPHTHPTRPSTYHR